MHFFYIGSDAAASPFFQFASSPWCGSGSQTTEQRKSESKTVRSESENPNEAKRCALRLDARVTRNVVGVKAIARNAPRKMDTTDP